MAESDQVAIVALAFALGVTNEEVHWLLNELNAARLQLYQARHRAKALGCEVAVFGGLPSVPLRRATFREVMAVVDPNTSSNTGGISHG